MVITHHGLVQLLVMNAIRRIPISWELSWDSTEEEIAAVVAVRVDEPEAMEEDTEDDDYVDQKEPKEMEMETGELEEEATPQEQAETVESMEDTGVDTERPTSITAEVVPQEPTSPIELDEQVDSMITIEVGPQQARVGELVNIATEGTPQGSPATTEPMEEDNPIQEEVMTTLIIESMEMEEQ